MSEFPKIENETDSSTDSEKQIGESRSSSDNFRTASEGPSLLEIVELLLSTDDKTVASNEDVTKSSNVKAISVPATSLAILTDKSGADNNLNVLLDKVINPKDDNPKDVTKITQRDQSAANLETNNVKDNKKTINNEFTEEIFFRKLSLQLSELSSRISHESNETIHSPIKTNIDKGGKDNNDIAFDTIKKQRRKLSNLLILAIVQNINDAFSEEGLENIKKQLREKIAEFQQKQCPPQSRQCPAGYSGQGQPLSEEIVKQPESCRILQRQLPSLQENSCSILQQSSLFLQNSQTHSDACEIEQHHFSVLSSEDQQQPTTSPSSVQQIETSTSLPKYLLASQQRLVTSSSTFQQHLHPVVHVQPLSEPGRSPESLTTCPLLLKQPATLAALQKQLIASAAIQLQLASSPLLQQLDASASPDDQGTSYTFLQEQITAFLTAQPSSSLFDSTSQELLTQGASAYLTPTYVPEEETNVLPDTHRTSDEYLSQLLIENILDVNTLRKEWIRNEGLTCETNIIDSEKRVFEGQEIERRSIKDFIPFSENEESITLNKCIAGERNIKKDGEVFDTLLRECLTHKKSLYTQTSIPPDVCSITKQAIGKTVEDKVIDHKVIDHKVIDHKVIDHKVIDTGLGDNTFTKEWTNEKEILPQSITGQKVINRTSLYELKESEQNKQVEDVHTEKDLTTPFSSTSKEKILKRVVVNDVTGFELGQRSLEKLSPEAEELITIIAKCIVQQVVNKSIVDGEVDVDLFAEELLKGRDSILSISNSFVEDLIRKSIGAETKDTEITGRVQFSFNPSLESIADKIILDVLNMSLLNNDTTSSTVPDTKELSGIQESITTVLCSVSDKVISKVSDAEVIESRKSSVSKPESICSNPCTVEGKKMSTMSEDKVIEKTPSNKKKKYPDSVGQHIDCDGQHIDCDGQHLDCDGQHLDCDGQHLDCDGQHLDCDGQHLDCDASCSFSQCEIEGNKIKDHRLQTTAMVTSYDCSHVSDGNRACHVMPRHVCLPEVLTMACNCSRLRDACAVASCAIPVCQCHNVCTAPQPVICVCDNGHPVQQRYCCHSVCNHVTPSNYDRKRQQTPSPRPEVKASTTRQTYSITPVADPTVADQTAADPTLSREKFADPSNELVHLNTQTVRMASSNIVDIPTSQQLQSEQSQRIFPLQPNVETSLTVDIAASPLNQVEQSQKISPQQQNMATSLTVDIAASPLNQAEQSQKISPQQQNMATSLTVDIAASPLNQVEQSQKISPQQQNMSTSLTVDIAASPLNQVEQSQKISPQQQNMATSLTVDIAASPLNQVEQSQKISPQQQNMATSLTVDIAASPLNQVEQSQKISPQQQNMATSLTVDIAASPLNQVEQSQKISPQQQNIATSLTVDIAASPLNQVEQSQKISPQQQNMATGLTVDIAASSLNQVEQSQKILPQQQNMATSLTVDIAAFPLNQVDQNQKIILLQQSVRTSEVIQISESQKNQVEEKLQVYMSTKNDAVDTDSSQLNQGEKTKDSTQFQQNMTSSKAVDILPSQLIQVDQNQKISALQEDVISSKAGYITSSNQIAVERNVKTSTLEQNIPIEKETVEQNYSWQLSNETANMSRVFQGGDNSNSIVHPDQDEIFSSKLRDSSVTSACSIKKENQDKDHENRSIEYKAYTKDSSGSFASNEEKISLPLIKLPRNVDINEAALGNVKKFSLKAKGLPFEEILKLSLGSLFDEKYLENFIKELNNNENYEEDNNKYDDGNEKDEDISKFTLNNSGNEMTEPPENEMTEPPENEMTEPHEKKNTESPENEEERQMSVAEMKEMFEKSKFNPMLGRQSFNEDFKMETRANEQEAKADEQDKNTIFVGNDNTPIQSPPYQQVMIGSTAGLSTGHTLTVHDPNHLDDSRATSPSSGLFVLPQRKSVSFSLTPDKTLIPEYAGGMKEDALIVSPDSETMNQEGHRPYINSPHPSATVLHYLNGKDHQENHEAPFEQSSALRKSLDEKKLISNTKHDAHSFTGSSDLCEEMEQFCKCCQESKKAKSAAQCSQQQRQKSDEDVCANKYKARCPCYQFQHDPCRSISSYRPAQHHCKTVSSCDDSCDDQSSERECSSQSTESEKCFRAKLDPNFTSIRICIKPNFRCRVCSDDCSCRDATSNDCLDTSTSLVSEICIEASYTQEEEEEEESSSSSEEKNKGGSNRRGKCPITCDSLEKEASEEENTGESGV